MHACVSRWRTMRAATVLFTLPLEKGAQPGGGAGFFGPAASRRDEKLLVDDLVALHPIAACNILVVKHADDIAGRDGRLLKAVLDHPGITQGRAEAQAARIAWLKKNPHRAHELYPEQFPKP